MKYIFNMSEATAETVAQLIFLLGMGTIFFGIYTAISFFS